MEVNLINALILICLSILAVIFGVLPITADPAVLKLSLLAPMFVLSLVYGLLPNMLRYLVCDVKQTKLKSISSLISSLLTCCAGGVILGLCILDLMPTAMHDFDKVLKYANWSTKYPFVELFIGLGLLLMFLIDELVKKAFHDDEDESLFDENAGTIMRSISEDTTASGHRTAVMFEAIRAASIRHREFGLDRKRTGTMSTFQVFSPKRKTMNRHTAKIFAMKEKNKKVTTQENTPHRTATCPEMVNKKKHEIAKRTFSYMIDNLNKKITTPEIKLRRQLLLQAFQEKSLSLDSGEKIQKKLSTDSEHEDKELPILEIFQEKKSNENIKKSQKSIKFAITTTKSDAEGDNEEEDYFPLPDVIDTTKLNGTEAIIKSRPSILKSSIKTRPTIIKSSMKKISTASIESSLSTSRSPLVKVLSSTFKRASFKNNPASSRVPTVELIESEDEEDDSSSNNNTITTNDPESGRSIVSGKSSTSDRPELPEDHQSHCLQALLVISVFFFHAFLEGFAFGIQEVSLNIMSLFFGIMVHKSLVMYSAGMNLMAKFADSKIKMFAFVAILALITPAGAIVGYVVEEAKFDKVAKYLLMTILHSLSIAMFLFLAIFEIIAEERANKHASLLQWIAYTAGFIVIAAILVAKDFTLPHYNTPYMMQNTYMEH